MRIYLYFLLFPIFLHAQDNPEKPIVYPKDNWYFGVEAGTNKTTSNELEGANNYFQAGLTGEYYFAKQWSVQGKLKFYDTEVSYDLPPTLLSDGAIPYSALYFKGKIISVPVDIKWEFRLYKNLKGFLSLGVGYNIETKSDYFIPSHPDGADTSMFDTNYLSLNGTIGVSYFLSDKWAISISSEGNSGGEKGRDDGFIWGNTFLGSENSLVNFGVKYNFKSRKQ